MGLAKKLSMIETARDYRVMSSAQPPSTEQYFEGLAVGEIRLMNCTNCETGPTWPWGESCPNCLSSRHVDWIVAKGQSQIISHTTVYRQYVESFQPPYSIALVELVEGPRLACELLGHGIVRIGDDATLVIAVGREGGHAPAVKVD